MLLRRIHRIYVLIQKSEQREGRSFEKTSVLGMAPKVKVTSEMIIGAAMDFVEQNGYDALTVRQVAQCLSCSTQPIYSCFSNMDDLKAEVCRVSREKCLSALFDGVSMDDFLCSLSKSLLKFALEKPKLFRSVFVMPYSGRLDLFAEIKKRYSIGDIFGAQGRMYDLSEADVRRVVDKALYFALGYAVALTGEGRSEFTEDMSDFLDGTIRELVSGFFLSCGY